MKIIPYIYLLDYHGIEFARVIKHKKQLYTREEVKGFSILDFKQNNGAYGFFDINSEFFYIEDKEIYSLKEYDKLEYLRYEIFNNKKIDEAFKRWASRKYNIVSC